MEYAVAALSFARKLKLLQPAWLPRAVSLCDQKLTVVIYSDTERDPALYRFRIDKHSRSLNTQLLYSYPVNAQSRFFVGYSDNSMQDAAVSALEATYRTVFAKFSYAWQY